jgi:integrase
MCGVRLEEIASLDAAQVFEDARYYVITKGKSSNAARVVPLAGIARDVIRKRFTKVNGEGPLFPEVPLRKSTGKRGGALSQAFTRLRRNELGAETDRQLVEHCFRHTWLTAARRAGIDVEATDVMGGWKSSRSGANDAGYDHGLEVVQYERKQQKIAQWLKDKGYLR